MQEHNKERNIWNEVRAGDETAFARLFYQYSDILFYYGCSITTDRDLIKDSIQELLCNLWERQSTLPEVYKVKPFLLSALRRILLRKIGKQKRFVLTPFTEEEQITTDFSNLIITKEDDLIEQELKEDTQLKLRKVIQHLSPRQREAIHLRYYEGLTYSEMAEVMAVKQSSIGHYIAQAIKALQKNMKRSMVLLFFFFALYEFTY